jgi:hypothetical protein
VLGAGVQAVLGAGVQAVLGAGVQAVLGAGVQAVLGAGVQAVLGHREQKRMLFPFTDVCALRNPKIEDCIVHIQTIANYQ